MATMFWIWMAAAVIFLIIEITSPSFLAICFAIAAAAAGVFAQFNPESYYWQVGLFIIASLVLLPLMRPLARRITKPSPVQSNIDRLIGQIGIVTKPLDRERPGQIVVDGETWRAVAAGTFAPAERVRVASVQGNRLRVERAEESEE